MMISEKHRSAIGIIILALVCALARPVAAQDPAPRKSELPADVQLDLFLLIGQSNMAGRGKVEAQDKVPHPHVWVLDKSQQWVPAVDPLHFDKPSAGVGMGLTFGKLVAGHAPKVYVGLIPCAVGGTSIGEWEKGGKLYANALRRAKLAMARGRLRAILWHQGEADSKPELAATYGPKLKLLIENFRADLNAPDIPFVAGQLGEFFSKKQPGAVEFNQRLLEIGRAVPHAACVRSTGLRSTGDGTHFDAAGQRELGRRYFAAYRQLSSER